MKRINNKDKGYKIMVLVAFLFLLFSTCYAEAAEYNATYAPGPIDPIATGQTKNVSVTVKNTGTQSWTPGVTFLSYHWYQGSTCIVWDGERTSLPKSLSPNETITLNAKVTANVPVGLYTLKWDMLGPATWFSQKNPPVPTGNQSVEVKSLQVKDLVSVPVGTSNVEALIKVVKAFPPPNIPNIKSVFPATAPLITPEGGYIISGSGFGPNPGAVKITLPSGKTTNLVRGAWRDDIIGVKVPPITGEMDGPASIWVETADGITSNKVSLNFIATRDFVDLPAEFVKADCENRVACFNDCMFCNTFSSSHTCWLRGDNGIDKFWATTPLKNGWLFYDYRYIVYSSSDPGTKATVTSFEGSSSTTMKITVNWSAPLQTKVIYSGIVFITGPKGVPYQ